MHLRNLGKYSRLSNPVSNYLTGTAILAETKLKLFYVQYRKSPLADWDSIIGVPLLASSMKQAIKAAKDLGRMNGYTQARLTKNDVATSGKYFDIK